MLLRVVVVGAAAAIVAPIVSANAQTASQIVRFQVNAVNQLAVTGNPSPLVVNAAAAGSAPAAATSAGTSYAITTNQANQKITASIDQAMPAGVSLEINLGAPAGASSAGDVSLNMADADVVTGISNTAATSLPITYRLVAAPSAQVAGPASRTVTFTIVAGS